MSKVKIKSHLHNLSSSEVYSSDVIGIKLDNKIKYIDNEINVIICVNENDIILERRCKEYHLTLHLSLNSITKGRYEIYSLGTIDLDIKTNKLKINANKIEINYILDFGNEENEFEYLVEMEELK